MKKWTALLLALVLCVAFALPAFAANGDETAEPQACSHTYTVTSSYVAYGQGVKVSANTCRRAYNDTMRCTKCGYTITVLRIDTVASSHSFTVSNATCNGSTQTWTNRCRYCSYSYLTYPSCPGGPHTPGSCNWLPI